MTEQRTDVEPDVDLTVNHASCYHADCLDPATNFGRAFEGQADAAEHHAETGHTVVVYVSGTITYGSF